MNTNETTPLDVCSTTEVPDLGYIDLENAKTVVLMTMWSTLLANNLRNILRKFRERTEQQISSSTRWTSTQNRKILEAIHSQTHASSFRVFQYRSKQWNDHQRHSKLNFWPYYGTQTCHICLGEFEDDDFVRTLRCGHTFHNECVIRWMQTKIGLRSNDYDINWTDKSCAVCKKKVFSTRWIKNMEKS